MGNLLTARLNPEGLGARDFVRCPCGAWHSAPAAKFGQITCPWCQRRLHLGRKEVLWEREIEDKK